MDQTLLILIALIILSGLFSGAEIALTSLSAGKVRSMKDDNRFASRAILNLKEKPQRLLVSILVGNQVVNVVATVLATIWGIKMFGENSITFVTLIFTFLLILFGSITPKTIALKFPDMFARIISFPLLSFIFFARPVVAVFEHLAQGFMWILKIDKDKFTHTVSSSEIEGVLDISAEEGVIDEEMEEIMKHVLKFNETSVEEIMTVLKDVKAIKIDTTNDDLMNFLMENDFSQFPVYEDEINNTKGVIRDRELMSLLKTSRKKTPLKDHKLKKLLIVPRTSSLIQLFKTFKKEKQRIAMVIDEHGQNIGIVSIGDIIQEIAGDPIEQNDRSSEKKMIVKIGKNAWEVSGETSIEDLNNELGYKLPHPDHDTVSLMILEALKRFPEANEKLNIDHIEIEIKKISKKTIDKVIIKKISDEESES